MISLKQLVATVTQDLEIWLKSSLFAFTEAELMGKSLGRDCMLFEIVTYIIDSFVLSLLWANETNFSHKFIHNHFYSFPVSSNNSSFFVTGRQASRTGLGYTRSSGLEPRHYGKGRGRYHSGRR